MCSQWNLGEKKKHPNFHKKHYFFFEIWGFHSVKTHNHTSYIVMFSFNLMAVVSVIAIFFLLLTKNDIIVHYNNFPKLGVYHAASPNLKGPRAPSQNCKKNPCRNFDSS